MLADLQRFMDSFGDHDADCPAFHASGRDAELATCRCGFARRWDFLDELAERFAGR